MIVFLSLLEIFCLVINFFVKTTIKKGTKSVSQPQQISASGGSVNDEEEQVSFLGSFVVMRYESELGRAFWLLLEFILVLVYWALFGASFAFNTFIPVAWKCMITIVLTFNAMFVAGSHTLSSKDRPPYLGVQSLNILFLFNIGLFIYGAIALNTVSILSNAPFCLLYILQVADFACLALTYLILGITYFLGREGHGGDEEPEARAIGNKKDDSISSSITYETSLSSPFVIDFVDLSISKNNISKARLKSKSLNAIGRGNNSENCDISENLNDNNDNGNHSGNKDVCIGMSVLPGRCRGRVKRDINTDLDRIRNHYKVDTIISLMPDEQLVEMKVPDLQRNVHDNGMFSIMAGWRDKWIPFFFTLDSTIALVDEAMERLRRGEKILIHCMGGKGRTGLVVTCILLNLGLSLPEAIAVTRHSRKGCIHNPLQLYYLNWYSNYYGSHIKNKKAVRTADLR